VGVAVGSVVSVVGVAVAFFGKIILHPGSDHARLVRIRVEMIKMKTDGLRRIPGDGWEERIGFSPLRKGKDLPKF
jgi:hypothetical protein